MQCNAKTVQEYLESLPEDRQQAISTVRDVILKNLPKGYQETMNWGMISYEVPLTDYPDTYNKQPMMYAALASQKNHMAVYMMGLYMDSPLRNGFVTDYTATGKKLDMGGACIRFKKLENLPLEVIGEYIAKVPADKLVAIAKSVKRK